jgi:SAM-dependent methyltransferase
LKRPAAGNSPGRPELPVRQSPPQPCPACDTPEARTLFQGTDRLYHTTGQVFQIVECANPECRLIRLSPQPTPAELAGYYPRTYWFTAEDTAASRLEEAYRRFVLRDHVAFVEQALDNTRARGPVLDVGCGGGLFLRLLAERGHPVAGLDLSPEAARVAWRRNGVPATAARLDRAPLRPGTCAGITMFHVLEHVPDPPALLDAARELLAPDGRLVVQVPNASSWQFMLFGENWTGIDIPRHLIDFRSSDLDSLLEYCGYEVLRHKYFSLRDNPAGFASSLAPALDPMARRIRGGPESPAVRLASDLGYFALVLAALPFTLLEAACRAGSTVMVEARKRP